MEPSQSTPSVSEPVVSTPGPLSEADGVTPSPPLEAPSGVDEDHPSHGVQALRIPRPEVGRLTGTLRVSELPRRKPTVVFDAGRRSRDAGDE
jgi:hypothetical protein